MKAGDRARLTRRFTPDDIRGFAALADIDAAAIATVPEPLIGALFSTLLGVTLPGRGTNYLKQEFDFIRPIPLDTLLTAEVAVTLIRPEKHLCDLATILTDETGAILATGRALVFTRDVGNAQA